MKINQVRISCCMIILLLLTMQTVGCKHNSTSIYSLPKSINFTQPQNMYDCSDKEDVFNKIVYRTDFPLIDIVFSKEDSWLLVNYLNMSRVGADNEQYDIITDRDVLERNKEFLSVNTMPLNRGTTPNGRIVIYKNGELYKKVDYIADVKIYSEELKNSILGCKEEDVQKFLNEGVRIPKF